MYDCPINEQLGAIELMIREKHDRTGGGIMNIQPIEITAVFIGKNSCGFRNGETYKLWMFQKNGKYYLSWRSVDAMAVPYDTMNEIRKNWKIVE